MVRWNSPYINHFIQPDSIIPDQTNPQSWDRYSYVQNNPVRFNDPTGHMEVEGCGDDGKKKCHASDSETALNAQKQKRLEKAVEIPMCKSGNKAYCTVQDNFINGLNAVTWRLVPSAIGLDYGFQMQYGLAAEAEVTPIEQQVIYNLRSKQLSVFTSSGTAGYIGSPTVLGGTGYVGAMTVYGASDNRYLAGDSKYLGSTAQADVVGKAGISKVVGASWDLKNNTAFIDPVSNIPVTFRQTNLIGGGNIFPDGLDVGVFAGQSYSQVTSWP